MYLSSLKSINKDEHPGIWPLTATEFQFHPFQGSSTEKERYAEIPPFPFEHIRLWI